MEGDDSFSSVPYIESFESPGLQAPKETDNSEPIPEIKSSDIDKCLEEEKEGFCKLCKYGYEANSKGICVEKVRDKLDNCFLFSGITDSCLECEVDFL